MWSTDAMGKCVFENRGIRYYCDRKRAAGTHRILRMTFYARRLPINIFANKQKSTNLYLPFIIHTIAVMTQRVLPFNETYRRLSVSIKTISFKCFDCTAENRSLCAPTVHNIIYYMHIICSGSRGMSGMRIYAQV